MAFIRHHDDNFSVELRPEEISRRLWVTGYSIGDPAALRRYLKELAHQHNMEKIIFPVKSSDFELIVGGGFIREGRIPGYFNGEDSYFLAAFTSQERSVSFTLENEKKMLNDITDKSTAWKKQFPPGITIRRAVKGDTPHMAGLFRSVFDSYPTPVFDPEYLAGSLDRGDIFMVAVRDSRIVAVAAAEIDRKHRRAELSDCATDPGSRGRGLNTVLLSVLEKECLSRNISCLFSLARASSYSMNLVLHRLGYVYGGTLVNNCHIGGGFENMNVWVRSGRNQKAVC